MAKHALLVAPEIYLDPEISPIKYAVADATALADRLRRVCGFSHVQLLADGSPDGAPDYNVVANALEELVHDLKPEDLFLFFFGGHGVELGEHGYLLTRDTRQRDPQRGLPLSRLMELLQQMEARQRILLLDACRNDPRSGRGKADHPMGEVLHRDIAMMAAAKPANDTTTVLFSACSRGQRAYEWSQKKHGVFTHFLLEGIDTAGWKNNELDFKRIAEHADEQVRNWSRKSPGEPQEPWYQEFGVPRSIVLARRVANKQPNKASDPPVKKLGSNHAMAATKTATGHKSPAIESEPNEIRAALEEIEGKRRGYEERKTFANWMLFLALALCFAFGYFTSYFRTATFLGIVSVVLFFIFFPRHPNRDEAAILRRLSRDWFERLSAAERRRLRAWTTVYKAGYLPDGGDFDLGGGGYCIGAADLATETHGHVPDGFREMHDLFRFRDWWDGD